MANQTFAATNNTDADAVLVWVDGDNNEVTYATLAAGKSIQQETFDGHTWRLRSSMSRRGELVPPQGRSAPEAGGLWRRRRW